MALLEPILAWLNIQCAAGFKHYSCQLAAFPYSTCYNVIPVTLGSVTITDIVVAVFALSNTLTALVSLYKWVRRHDKDEQAALRQNYGSVGTAAFFALTALACAVVVICSFDTFAYTTAAGIGLRSAYVGLYSAAWAAFGMDQFVATISRRLSRALAVLACLGCLGIGPLVGISLNLITPKFVPDRNMQVFVLVVFLVAVPVVAMLFCILGSFFAACRGSLVGNKQAFIFLSFLGIAMAAAGPVGHYYWWSETCPVGVTAQIDISMIEQVALFLCLVIVGQAGASHANLLSKGSVQHTTMSAAFNDASYGDAPPAYERECSTAGFIEAGHIPVDTYGPAADVPYVPYSPPAQYHAMGHVSPPDSARSYTPLLAGPRADVDATQYSTVSMGQDATRIVVPPPAFAPAVEPYDSRPTPPMSPTSATPSATAMYGPPAGSRTASMYGPPEGARTASMYGPPEGARTASMYGPPEGARTASMYGPAPVSARSSMGMYGPPLSPRSSTASSPQATVYGQPAAQGLWMPRGEEDLRHIAEIHSSLQNIAGVRPLSMSDNELRLVVGEYQGAPETAPYEPLPPPSDHAS